MREGCARAMFPAMERVSGMENETLKADLRPDFRHVRNWVFDLDNTLYDAGNGIFSQIESRMTDYVVDFLGLPRDEARRRQKDLYHQYGTTLNGLMVEHACDAEHYLDFVHDIDLSSLAPDADLIAAIQNLPGRRFVFTNGCRAHAARILDRLEMAQFFELVWDIRTIGFAPKPDPSAYARVVAAGGFDATTAAMFDDLPRNLGPARALGMTTVWLKTDAPWAKQGPLAQAAPGDIDHETENLTQFLHNIRI
ncbi:MAG: pyrimidine 5'-nucleotidase [Rubrivivax sp.]|nr:MAG: pyrimidine 5'-nucleotidase [Rubrivivax sp.]